MIFGAPDGPDPPDGAGVGIGGQGEVGTSPLSPAWPADHFYVPLANLARSKESWGRLRRYPPSQTNFIK